MMTDNPSALAAGRGWSGPVRLVNPSRTASRTGSRRMHDHLLLVLLVVVLILIAVSAVS
jgi:hypothetical protein